MHKNSAVKSPGKRLGIETLCVKDYKPGHFINITAMSLRARADNARCEDKVVWNMTWQCIKRNNPDIAEMIQCDDVRDLAKRFNASILVDYDQLHPNKGAL